MSLEVSKTWLCSQLREFSNTQVAAKFATYPPHVREKLLALRAFIFRIADATHSVGEIEESLKWGEPAYTPKNKSGSTVRIDWKKKTPNHYLMYFHCQTHLIDLFRTRFPHDFKFEGNRALVFSLEEQLPLDVLAICIAESFTYHLKKRNTDREK